jgi:hypothetical protein
LDLSLDSGSLFPWVNHTGLLYVYPVALDFAQNNYPAPRTAMQLTHHFHLPRVPVTPLARPQRGNNPSSWPFLVQAPQRPCSDVEANARRVLETSKHYFSIPAVAEPVAAPKAQKHRDAQAERG